MEPVYNYETIRKRRIYRDVIHDVKTLEYQQLSRFNAECDMNILHDAIAKCHQQLGECDYSMRSHYNAELDALMFARIIISNHHQIPFAT